LTHFHFESPCHWECAGSRPLSAEQINSALIFGQGTSLTTSLSKDLKLFMQFLGTVVTPAADGSAPVVIELFYLMRMPVAKGFRGFYSGI